MSASEKRTQLEIAEELFQLLQGVVPEGHKIEQDHVPKLTPDQAWTVVWYLGNLYTAIADHIERCDECGDLVDSWSEHIEWVESIGKRLCETCYKSKKAFECCACDNHDCHDAPGRLVVVAEEVQGLLPGLYRITAWPFYADGMITGFVFEDKFQRVGEIPESAATNGYAMGFLCKACEQGSLSNKP